MGLAGQVRSWAITGSGYGFGYGYGYGYGSGSGYGDGYGKISTPTKETANE